MASNAQVAHVWAQQTKSEGKGSSFYFEGDTIYSFGGHFPIARFVNPSTVLLTIENGWGGYTGRHIGHVVRALRGLPVNVIHCLEPATRNGCHGSRILTAEVQQLNNLEDYAQRFRKALESACRARSNADLYLERAAQIRAWCRAYCKLYRIKFPGWVRDEIPGDLDAIRARAVERLNKEREAKRVKLARDVARWQAGELVNISEFPDTLLRLSRNGRMVETSRGAQVPVEDARALWAIVARCKREGRRFNALGMTIGNFGVREIESSGNVRIGCHYLQFEECARFASAQGWQ